jgi:hypothetical protein
MTFVPPADAGGFHFMIDETSRLKQERRLPILGASWWMARDE